MRVVYSSFAQECYAILIHNTSYDAVSHKEVPFWGLDDEK